MTLKEYIEKVIETRVSEVVNDPKVLAWAKRRMEFVSLSGGGKTLKKLAKQCQKNNKWYPLSAAFKTVYVALGEEFAQQWCQSSVERYAKFCEFSQAWFEPNAVFTAVTVEGDVVCYELAENVIYRWRDGSFHYREEPSPPAPQVHGYHSQVRKWESESPTALVYGVEVELLATTNRGEVARLAESCGFLAERDGSLDDSRGVEVIGAPMPFEDYAKPDSPWMKFLDGVQGHAKGGGDGYGIHVNINRRNLTALHSGKIICFVNENQSLCERVAGRSSEQWARFKKKKITSAVQRDVYENRLALVPDGEKYEAMAIRGQKRLEFRIFKATVDKSLFLSTVEFSDSIVSFSRDASCRQLTEKDYMAWMLKNHSKYPNLAKKFDMIKSKKKELV